MEPNYTTRILNHAIQTCGFYLLRPRQVCLFDMQLTKARSAMLNLQILFKLDDAIISDDGESSKKKTGDTVSISLKTGNTMTIQSSDTVSGAIVFADTTWHFTHNTQP